MHRSHLYVDHTRIGKGKEARPPQLPAGYRSARARLSIGSQPPTLFDPSPLEKARSRCLTVLSISSALSRRTNSGDLLHPSKSTQSTTQLRLQITQRIRQSKKDRPLLLLP
mmetsp:Transcript_18832/g.36945  ORF Transcript_18832/g.36945 Transcript_18832/m.36945 type:complete len:111 (+) Transcript_18832:1036-1368(+)